jgi:hypothetical protein
MIIRHVTPSGLFSPRFSEDDHQAAPCHVPTLNRLADWVDHGGAEGTEEGEKWEGWGQGDCGMGEEREL